ncbi:type II toxin-antitoxin system RelE/ParE family toxin [Methylotenera sp.]|uniref:type II toxin-antitoxin system RelE/ParE family toxin n=1 Tax=Methylotenera sp. TaxID=2051956 RepID=UPI002734AC04|nr:type II toxin-antitoxin system RelE/ParE family toxin [Methylotenera sp.]MDP3308974.1 type II toxin-antitoxin system RelE/ParE family toxin [Methylotenera sp.]
MSYDVLQTKRFGRQYKKLNTNVVHDVDAAVAEVAETPNIGERKKGDLASLFVYKFRSQNQLYLLGYTLDDGLRLVYLQAVSSHENFYRDMKRN